MREVIAALAAMLAIALAGCGTTKPERTVTVYQKVKTPIYQPCQTTVDLNPIFPLDEGPIADDIAQAVKDLHEDRFARKAWTAEAVAALRGCAGKAVGEVKASH